VKRPTMEDVAREAGVSRALVSLVFRGMPNVSDQRRQAVLDAADRLGYQLHAVASRLASHRSRVMGFVINDLGNPVFAEVVQEFQERADTDGYRVVLSAAGHESAREQIAIETLLEQRPDGLVISGSLLPAKALAKIAQRTPLTLVGRVVREVAVDCVATDDRHGAELAVEHLASLGHHAIAHIDGGKFAGARDRRNGYQRAMKRLGLQGEIRIVPGEHLEQAGIQAAHRLLAEGLPTAVFAANDLIAVGLMDTLRGAGVRVPEDVSIVGFDDTILARLSSISLTTLSQTTTKLGTLAFETVLSRADGLHTESLVKVVEPQLVVRGSTAAPS
jgi:DNA-binding LacI/PurR family transcriptional regulator